MSRGLLITGATGQQGGGVIDNLIASPKELSDFTILAVTRNPNSPSAQKLAAKSPQIKIVKGDMNDVPALFTTAQGIHSNIWGVFSVQVPMGQGQTVQTEEAQGKALIDAALEHGVEQFVQTSVDRGGDKSFDTPTTVAHFISKHNIERYLVEKTKDSSMSYTILRPVAFMENLKPGFPSKVFAALLRDTLPPTKPIQFVSVKDIGFFAAEAFRKPEQNHNRAISIAGDSFTFSQMDNIFKEATGSAFPVTYSIFGSVLAYMVKDFGEMMKFFATDGYAADIKARRAENPEMMDLKTWLQKESAFVARS